MINEALTCAFTGCRSEKLPWGFNERADNCIRLKNDLAQKVKYLITKKNVKCFLSGMAQGIDTYAAECVISLKTLYPDIKLIAAVPFPQQAKTWQLADKERYNSILSRCDEVVMVSPRRVEGVYHIRNRYMVDNADYLIAVYSPKINGGSKYTVEYAKGKSIEIIKFDLSEYNK